MKQRAMGSLEWPVSALGFGAMRLPSKRMNPLSPDQAKCTAIIRSGIDQGISYVDTAYVYPGSEKAVGVALKDGYRERVHLVSKLPVFLTRKTQDFDKYLATSLERLQTDFLDIYLLHAMNAAGFEKVQRLGLLDKMVEARDAGLIRHIGFSFHDTLPVFKSIVDAFDWDLCQIQYNYMDTCLQAGTEGLEYAAGKGIAVVIMEPLKGGSWPIRRPRRAEIMRSSGVDRTPVDWALQFLWNRPEVSCRALRHGLPADGRRQLRQCRSLGRGHAHRPRARHRRAARRRLPPPHGRALHRVPLLHALPVRREHPPELRHLEQRVHEGRRMAEPAHQAQLSQARADAGQAEPGEAERQRGDVHQVRSVRTQVPAGNRHPYRAREVRGGAAVACSCV